MCVRAVTKNNNWVYCIYPFKFTQYSKNLLVFLWLLIMISCCPCFFFFFFFFFFAMYTFRRYVIFFFNMKILLRAIVSFALNQLIEDQPANRTI
jgi:hypothetical protein